MKDPLPGIPGNPEENTTVENEKKAQLVPVEELIPGIKPEIEGARVGFRGLDNDNTYVNDLLRTVESKPEFSKFFKDFQGQIVVDLGAGAESSDYKVIMATGARAYVGVEPNFIKFLSSDIAELLKDESKKTESAAIPAAVVESDALTFLRRLPDKSVSVFSSGTGAEVLLEDYDYIDEVSKEIERVLHPNGAFVGYSSSFELNPKNFELEDLRKEAKDFRPHFFPFELYRPKAGKE